MLLTVLLVPQARLLCKAIVLYQLNIPGMYRLLSNRHRTPIVCNSGLRTQRCEVYSPDQAIAIPMQSLRQTHVH